MKEKELKKYHLMPRNVLSVDHYIFWSPGRIYHTRFKSFLLEIFSGGCVFVDHTSGYISINNQVAKNYSAYSGVKMTLQRKGQSWVVVIKIYHNDNGIFNS